MMKIQLFSAYLLTLLPVIILAQFSPVVFIDTEQEEFTSLMKIADFNNDGNNDIISIAESFPDDFIKLYLNGADNEFSSTMIDSQNNIRSIDAADINNDSRIDFAIISGNGATTNLTWYENQPGNFTPHFLANIDDGMNQVILNDFNNDGLIDMLTLEHMEVVLRRAVSPGVFDEREVLAGATEYYAIDANDYNSDGFLDVAVATAMGFIILTNNGGDSFSAHSQAGDAICFGLQSGDVDADGDNDIIAYDTLRGLRLYKNDGLANFQYHSTIINSMDNFRIFGLVDLNCDGALDLHTVISQQGQVIWLSNDGLGNFSSPIIVHDFDGLIYSSANGDLNNDDKPELIFGRNDLAMVINQCEFMNLTELQNSNIEIYPNPVTDFLYIKNNPENLDAYIFDATGRTIGSNISDKNKIDVSRLEKGVYYLKLINSDRKIQIFKFIKK